ncbi:MAG: OsmC family protein [Gammaproteobacteria bacterium]|jgi:uncharacterized OsmC-like protein
MKIELRSDTEIILSQLDTEGFEVTPAGPEHTFGSMQMFVTSVGMCTFSVLASYGQRLGASADGIVITLKWSYGERPYRIAEIEMRARWPQLPESRLDAATRAAHHCTLHNTLRHETEVVTLVEH